MKNLEKALVTDPSLMFDETLEAKSVDFNKQITLDLTPVPLPDLP